MAECVLSLIVAETVQRSTNQERQGYETGYRFVEQMSERRLGTDPLEVMKFLCKELWFGMFGKQVDKLQTNHRGVFVLKDFQFRWLSRVSCADLEAKAAYEEKLLRYACGVLRGALANLGLEAAVTANAQAPACSFSVQLKT